MPTWYATRLNEIPSYCINPHIVRKAFILIFIGLIFSCEKESPLNTITPIPGWVVESLNEDFYIQIPINYRGNGFKDNCFDKSNPSNDIIINQCYCYYYDLFSIRCVGDCIAEPLPDSIIRLPSLVSSTFLYFSNKEYLYKEDSIFSGIIYYSDGFRIENEDVFIVDALYYKKIDSEYTSMVKLQRQ